MESKHFLINRIIVAIIAVFSEQKGLDDKAHPGKLCFSVSDRETEGA